MLPLMDRIRHAINPRSRYSGRGTIEPPKVSSIILTLTLVTGGVVLVAKAITEFLATA